MSIYRLSLSTVKRSEGRSSVAAAAYAAGTKLYDARTGLTHDYTRKGLRGVVASRLLGWSGTREDLWNAVEKREVRRDAQVARTIVLALPHEAPSFLRNALAFEFAKWLSERYGCAIDVSVHRPGRTGDHRQHHAHILMPTREMGTEGKLGAKMDSLGNRALSSGEVEAMREAWAEGVNAVLVLSSVEARVDHRSYSRQGRTRRSGHLSRPAFEREQGGVSGPRKRRGLALSRRDALGEARERLRQPVEAPQADPTETPTEKPRIVQQPQSPLTDAERESIREAIRRAKDVARHDIPATVARRRTINRGG